MNTVSSTETVRPPMMRPGQRRILLATGAELQRHRHHADDGGERSHQNRAAGERGRT